MDKIFFTLLSTWFVLSLSNTHVTYISAYDGDTYTMINKGDTVKVRLWGVDCPELKQSGGKEALFFAKAKLMGSEDIKLDCKSKSYQRQVCKVTLDGGIDLGTELVRNGMCYDSKQYSKGYYSTQQQVAEANKLGVWADQNRVYPWEYRKSKRGVK